MTAEDDPLGPARQTAPSDPVPTFEEEKKGPMPSQTVMPAGAAKSAPSGSGPPRDMQRPIEQVDTS